MGCSLVGHGIFVILEKAVPSQDSTGTLVDKSKLTMIDNSYIYIYIDR